MCNDISRWMLAVLLYWLAALGGEARAAIAGVDPEFAGLIARCAPTVDPGTMAAIVSAESRGHQYAIADAGPVGMPWAQRKHLVRSYFPGSTDAAVAAAERLIAAGHTVSLGLAQVNDRNLARLGLSVRAVFDPCKNLAAGGAIVTAFYKKAVAQYGPGSRALRAAISAYNSGDFLRGENEGYVGLVYKQVGRPLVMKTAAVGVVVPEIRPVATGGVKGKGAGHKVAALESKEDGGRTFTMSVSDFVIKD